MVAILLAEETCDAQLVEHCEGLKEPVHEVSLVSSCGLKLRWSSACYQHNSVNEHASRAACETIRGDAFIISDQKDLQVAELIHALQMNRRLAFITSVLQPRTLSWKLQPLCSSSCVLKAARSATVPPPLLTQGTKTHSAAGRLLKPATTRQTHPAHLHHSLHSPWRIQAMSHSAGHVTAPLHVDDVAHMPATLTGNASGSTEPQHAAPPASQPLWQDLSVDVLGHVAMCLPPRASQQLLLAQVCSAWRQALLTNNQVIQCTWFALDCHQPFKHPGVVPAWPAAGAQARQSLTRRMLPPRGGTAGGQDASVDVVQRVNGSKESRKGLQPQARLKAALPHLPMLMKRAVTLGNTSAMGCMAQLLEVCGERDQAHKLWVKCAKLGDAEACLHTGIACYQGLGVPVDSESAQMWLSRGLKKLLGLSHWSLFSVDHVGGTVTLPAAATHVWGGGSGDGDDDDERQEVGKGKQKQGRRQESEPAADQAVGNRAGSSKPSGSAQAVAQPTVTISLQELWSCRRRAVQSLDHLGSSSSCWSGRDARHGLTPCIDFNDEQLTAMVACCAVMLAYIYFDGEGGLRVDREQACTLFKLAALCGSNEAARVLGWIFSTGQYGP